MQRKLRLRNRQDFNRIYRGGRSFANSQLVVYWKRTPEVEHFRMGVSVSKKLGNAVVRNRMRRVLKEIVRLQADRIGKHVDFILIARRPAIGMRSKDLERSVLHVLRKAKLLSR
ncbi:ribonuclease P protein component [Paenibacillus sp. IB182496]|uniref:Ribonuclease P protein component n=1 Tax=Paenibacillus sabuli TaxID=2772509 RepID=A0A927BWA0_9BACL|nr:ribonuclease P protein component [Paenibacillus sabuli]MBD2848022.1 ribonuclease P protein component [Paenibacillus sabuli]